MPLKLRKIISGGQTGADRAGLEVALELGLATGGTAPKGYRTENGPDLSLLEIFGLDESESNDYAIRTRQNVADADLTAIFGKASSSGSALTARCCVELDKPFTVNPTAAMLRRHLEQLDVQVLNIAGNRASKNPGVGEIGEAGREGGVERMTRPWWRKPAHFTAAPIWRCWLRFGHNDFASGEQSVVFCGRCGRVRRK